MAIRIFLLHGWNQDKKVWNDLVKNMDEKCTAFDLPGFGEEIVLNKSWGVTDYANWTKEKIEKSLHSGEKAILLGHSFGGRLALEIAAKKPEWLMGLILSGSPNIYRPKMSTKLKIFVSKLLKNFLSDKIKNLLLPVDLKDAQLNQMGGVFRRVVSYDQTELLNGVSVPTLLIWGEFDLEVPVSMATEMQKRIKNCRLSIIDNAGHNSFINNQNLYIGNVKKFIRDIK